jgi:PAS domain S-box-containing protein
MTANLLLKLPDYLTSLFDAMQDGFVLRSPSATILDVNQSFCRLVGYDREEIIGQGPPHPWWPPEQRAVFEAAHARYLTGATAEDDLIYQRRDGERIPVAITSAPLRDGDGRIIGFIGTVKDISERSRAAQALRESEDRFRTMADNTPALIWTAGTDMGRTYFNQVWLDFVGRALDQELGFGWADHIHPDDYQHCLGTYRRAFEVRAPFEVEYRMHRHDGDYRWMLDQGVPRIAPDGGFVGYIGSCIDITERRRAEERQRFLAEASTILASSLDYRTTLNSVARLVVPRLADWCAVDLVEEPPSITLVALAHVNPAKVEWAKELRTKYPVDLEAATGVAQVLRSGQAELYPEIPDEMVVAGARDAEHLAIIRAVGFVSAMIVPLAARDQVFGVITLVSAESGRRYGPEDLAFVKELARRAAIAVDNARLFKEAQEALRARDQFLAVAAHELRSPLTSTKGFAQLLLRRAERSPGGDEWLAPLRTIDNQVNKVVTLVNRLLDVSRIQEHRLQLQIERGDLLAVVREAVADAQLAAEGHRIVLESEAREVIGDWDRTRVGQVLANLLDNAVKYSPSGSDIVVTVRADDEQAVVSVEDHGSGITPEARARLFERYFRTDAASRSGSEGMGLGLYVAKGIIDAHGGDMWVASELGRGSTFSFSLPRDARVQQARTAAADQAVERE